ncbi:cytochrome c biogenesis protein [Haloferula sp.]|uniref:cytochrome c biogenesis protein n=1 Tax=Haloferula sp. TaxID=2497595 RepID=UPI00329D31E3
MKRLLNSLSWLIPVLCLVGIAASAFRATRSSSDWELQRFGELPVVSNGRIQPLDALARNAILTIHGKQKIPGENPPSSPIEWLLELGAKPAVADARPIFLIHHDDVLGIVKLTQSEGKSFSYNQLEPSIMELSEESQRIGEEPAGAWSPYDKALMKLWRNIGLYLRLKHAFALPEEEQLESEILLFLSGVDAAIAEAEKRNAGEEFNAAVIDQAATRMRSILEWSPKTHIFTKPPVEGDTETEWRKMADSVIDALDEEELHPSTIALARVGDSYRAGGDEAKSSFKSGVEEYTTWLAENRPDDLGKCRAEALFNRIAPFALCMALYVVAFLCAIAFWLTGKDGLRSAAFRVLLIGLAIHTIGLIVRMALEGRPPVTNLYSSAVFIGWGAIVLSAVLEWFYKNAIGSAVAAMTGFTTLVIAHHLSLSGDTLEMMRAVLDSNFWLATHVIVITLGYSATFLAGAIAIVYLIRHVFGGVPKSVETSMKGMVYGTLCFATLASFVGTVLGGIWADQSWGRFWGWDPKENGALLIVLWNAIILHARWGGMIRAKGMMVMAVFGNIVTSWSWFGTNMLGIGLHSYGFTDAAFFWLSVFIISQLVIMGLGLFRRNERRA